MNSGDDLRVDEQRPVLRLPLFKRDRVELSHRREEQRSIFLRQLPQLPSYILARDRSRPHRDIGPVRPELLHQKSVRLPSVGEGDRRELATFRVYDRVHSIKRHPVLIRLNQQPLEARGRRVLVHHRDRGLSVRLDNVIQVIQG